MTVWVTVVTVWVTVDDKVVSPDELSSKEQAEHGPVHSWLVVVIVAWL